MFFSGWTAWSLIGLTLSCVYSAEVAAGLFECRRRHHQVRCRLPLRFVFESAEVGDGVPLQARGLTVLFPRRVFVVFLSATKDVVAPHALALSQTSHPPVVVCLCEAAASDRERPQWGCLRRHNATVRMVDSFWTLLTTAEEQTLFRPES